ncbi:hypothetical protein [Streptomyces sp. YPW6]|uniref:hypothetical protein n=1 Tax=Streptomyces sp. YPW6 TaxID=2840373 RepID=UPI003EB8F6A4
MGVLREVGAVFAGVGQVPGMVWRSTREMAAAVSAWLHAERRRKKAAAKKGKDDAQQEESGGELFARLLVLCVLGYVLAYLTSGRSWLWSVYGGAWFLGCVVLAARRGDLPAECPGDHDEQAGEEGRLRRFLGRWSKTEEKEPDEDDTPENDHETLGEEDPDEPGPIDPEAERARRVALIWERVEHAVAAAVQAGTRGARTVDLLTEFQSGGALETWDEKQFRDMLRSIGIPVREQMYFKVGGEKKNQPGVHAEDLTNSLGRAPRLPAHLVPDLTPVQPLPPTLSLVKDGPPDESRAGVA